MRYAALASWVLLSWAVLIRTINQPWDYRKGLKLK